MEELYLEPDEKGSFDIPKENCVIEDEVVTVGLTLLRKEFVF